MNIRQIIPANGWWVMFKTEQGKISFAPVMVWALIKEMERLNIMEFEKYHYDFVGLDKVATFTVSLKEVKNFVKYSEQKKVEK